MLGGTFHYILNDKLNSYEVAYYEYLLIKKHHLMITKLTVKRR